MPKRSFNVDMVMIVKVAGWLSKARPTKFATHSATRLSRHGAPASAAQAPISSRLPRTQAISHHASG